MDEVSAFSVECRKCNMSYGQYVRAIERGELRPPKNDKKAVALERKHRECSRCGNIFEVRITSSGYVSQAKLCPSCLKESQRKHGAAKRTWSEYIICKKCGLPFKRERYPNGRLMNRQYCSDCGGNMQFY